MDPVAAVDSIPAPACLCDLKGHFRNPGSQQAPDHVLFNISRQTDTGPRDGALYDSVSTNSFSMAVDVCRLIRLSTA
jgi:hypothetical protein